MSDVRDRVQKLIALALRNPNAEEARSAALMAVRMIDQHKLLAPAPPPVVVPTMDSSLFDQLRQAQAASQQRSPYWNWYQANFRPGRGVE